MKKILVFSTLLFFLCGTVNAQGIVREKTFNSTFDTVTDKLEKNLSKYYNKNISLRTSVSNGKKGGHTSINWDTVYDENGENPQRDKFKLFVRELSANSVSVKLFYDFEYTSNGSYTKPNREMSAALYSDMWEVLEANNDSSLKEKQFKKVINGKKIAETNSEDKKNKKSSKTKSASKEAKSNKNKNKSNKNKDDVATRNVQAENNENTEISENEKSENTDVLEENKEAPAEDALDIKAVGPINTEVIVPDVEEAEVSNEKQKIDTPQTEPIESIVPITNEPEQEEEPKKSEIKEAFEAAEQAIENTPVVLQTEQAVDIAVEAEQSVKEEQESSASATDEIPIDTAETLTTETVTAESTENTEPAQLQTQDEQENQQVIAVDLKQKEKEEKKAQKLKEKEELKKQKEELAAQRQKEKEELAEKKEQERQALIAVKLQQQEEAKKQKEELAAQRQKEKEEKLKEQEEAKRLKEEAKQKEKEELAAKKLQEQEELKRQQEAELAAIKQKEEDEAKRAEAELAAANLKKKQQKQKEHEDLEKSKSRTYDISYYKVYSTMLENVSKNVKGIATSDEEQGIIVTDWTYSGNALQSHKAKRRFKITLRFTEISENQTGVSAETEFETFLIDWKKQVLKDTFLTDYYNSLFNDLEEGLK